MRHLILVLAVILSSTVSSATIRRVAKDGSGDYSTITAAVAAAPAGDTVVVMGDLGYYSESTITVTRLIALVGQGTGCMNVPPTEFRSGNLTFATGSTGSIMEGFYLNGSHVIVNAGVAGITVRRCRIADDYSIIVNGSSLIEECTLAASQWSIDLNTQGSSVTVKNSVVCNYGGLAGEDVSPLPSITAYNCAFVGCTSPLGGDATWNIEHCVFWDCNQVNGAGLGYFVASYNAFNQTPANFPYDAAVDTTILQDPFVNYNEASNYLQCISDLNLLATSGLIDRGDPNAAPDRDGSPRDLGIYGGPNPFVDTGAPDFPFVTQLFVPATIPQNGVLEIRSTGRVGEGN